VYAPAYLRQACASARIGSYYDGDAFDLDRFDCYVIPAWHFTALNAYRYDALVSINSLQEMAQHHVDWYLSLMDGAAADGAICYFNNAHDYLFKGAWRYPPHWRKLLCASSPRSWSANHPTEVFTVDRGVDHAGANAALDALFNATRQPG
jgi:hypothetical protein